MPDASGCFDGGYRQQNLRRQIVTPFLITQLIGVAGIFLVIFIFSAIWASHFRRVGPNRVLIVSGRQNRLPDGTLRGYRIIRGGGTFVIPVLETENVLSLEVFSIEMPKCKARTADAAPVEADCVAQVKIKADDPSILAAAEHFLSKDDAEMKDIIKPVLERHLSSVLGSMSREEIGQNPEAGAARMQTAATADLAGMGLGLVSFTIRNIRSG